jgi:phage baseplate assembly protein W
MADQFLGRGWGFPVAVDNGRIVEVGHDAKIRQAIEIILRTAPGERVTRPDFGCGIHDLVFESLSNDMLGRVISAVTTALATWEPRIDVLDVSPQQDADQPNRILIEIDYRVRSTNSRLNLVFPFYVQS